VAINIVGVSGKFFLSLGKIGVCPEKFFDSQNGTLTENFFGDGQLPRFHWWGERSPKKILK
jgi:hypothetical protein